MRGTIPEDQGAIFSLPVANPGAGNPLYIIATDSKVWRLHSIKFIFTSGATVANRQIYLEWNNGINVGARLWSTFVQTAGMAVQYNLVSWLSTIQYTTAGEYMMAFSGGALIDGAEYLMVSALLFPAGDTFTGCIVTGERWLAD